MRNSAVSITLVSAAILCLLAMPVSGEPEFYPASEDTTVELYICPDDTSVVVNHEFQLRVCIAADSADLMGYNVTVQFDSLYLKILSADEGYFPASFGYPTFFRWLNEGGGDDFAAVNGAILGHPIRGHGSLFTLTFKPVRLGIAEVRITAGELRDGENGSIVHKTKNGIVRIISSIDAESVTWGVIKNRYSSD